MADDAKDELKALVVRARQEKLGPFPETLRQRLLRYANERWRAGVSVHDLMTLRLRPLPMPMMPP